MKSRLLILLALAAAALAAAAVAVASTVTATATVTGAGSLALSNGATATISDTLDGTDQAVNYTLPLTMTDARGTGTGWNLTITSTTFTTGTHTLATSASSIASVASACVAGGTCTNPASSISYPLTVPAAATAPTAVKLFNAAANSGLGRFTITPSINVTIPGNSYAGSYTSTLTIAAVSGP
ncbi:MAG TPA: WxL domain-containing protein [Gaiellaceae bacterium]|nr:WxL domain-containing protein [Gaiellaceae bacterium]